jgi:hypothetical protein
VREGTADAAVEAPHLAGVEARGDPERIDARAPKRLVHVDVAHSGERPLIEQSGLDRGAASGETATEVVCCEDGIERLLPHPGREVGLDFTRLEYQPGAEPPDVAVRDVRFVV